jgi:UTP:GlnB (protein PII) uridylyltransferase
MNEAGVLPRFVPEFGLITAQMQFDRHHAYTTDEHTLRGVGLIADIQSGRLAADHPLSTSLVPRIADPEALYLGMLLHDVGKGGLGGQLVAGPKAARRACLRLGLSPARPSWWPGWWSITWCSPTSPRSATSAIRARSPPSRRSWATWSGCACCWC